MSKTEKDSKKMGQVDSGVSVDSNWSKKKKKMHALQKIPFPNEVTQPIVIELCNIPEGDGFKHLIVCPDYFSKCSEAKSIIDKFAATVANFCTG